MHRIDGDGATADNKFTEGNPATGMVATTVTSDWLNAVQAEIINVLIAAGISPSKADNSQLLQAIQSIISGGGVAVTAAGVSIADSGDYFGGTEVEAALQQLAQKVYAGTVNANQVRRQVVPEFAADFPLQPYHAESIVQSNSAVSATYRILSDSDLNLPIGTSIEVAQGGAGKVTFVGGAGVTIRCHAAFNPSTLGPDATAVIYKVAPNTWRLGGMLEAAA